MFKRGCLALTWPRRVLLTPSADTKSLHSDYVEPRPEASKEVLEAQRRLIVFQVPTSQGSQSNPVTPCGCWPALGLISAELTSPGSSVCCLDVLGLSLVCSEWGLL